MEKELYCYNCEQYSCVNVIKRNEVYIVKGEKIEVEVQVCVCEDCGEELFDKELDELNIERALEKYRENHGLLSPGEIKAIRETYGLNQNSFCKLLNWKEITMNRYEMGAIQDKVHNNTLMLLKNPKNMLNVLDNNLGVLPPAKEKILREKITELLSETAVTNLNK